MRKLQGIILHGNELHIGWVRGQGGRQAGLWAGERASGWACARQVDGVSSVPRIHVWWGQRISDISANPLRHIISLCCRLMRRAFPMKSHTHAHAPTRTAYPPTPYLAQLGQGHPAARHPHLRPARGRRGVRHPRRRHAPRAPAARPGHPQEGLHRRPQRAPGACGSGCAAGGGVVNTSPN